MIDFNQNMIQLYLGANSSHLLPRIKTLELYRKNAKNLPILTFYFNMLNICYKQHYY